MPSIFDEIKPFVVTSLHKDRQSEFIRRFTEQNGHPPSQDELNAFTAHLIAVGNIDEEANEITQELVNKATKQRRIRNILLNTSYTIPVCTALALLIIFLFLGTVPETFKSGAARYIALATTILLLLLTLIFTVVMYFQDQDK